MFDKKKLVIIILNYNNYHQTINLLKQLAELEYPIVVVDNASPNESWTVLTSLFKDTKYVSLIKSDENNGYSNGNNQGIARALRLNPELEYIAIMNPDIELCDKIILERMCLELEKDSKLAALTAVTIFNGVLSGQNSCASKLLTGLELLVADVALLSKTVKRNYNNLVANKNNIAYVDKIQGCFFVIKKDVFEKVGFFDEHVFLYFEEDILGYKLRGMGYRLGVLITNCIKHNHEGKDSEMLDLTKRTFYNKCFLDSKKYYMLNIRNESKLLWGISYFLDFSTRKIKNMLIYIRGVH